MTNLIKKLKFSYVFVFLVFFVFILIAKINYEENKKNKYVSLEDLKEFTNSDPCYKQTVLTRFKDHQSLFYHGLYKGGITYLDIDRIKKSCIRKAQVEEDLKIMKQQFEAIQ